MKKINEIIYLTTTIAFAGLFHHQGFSVNVPLLTLLLLISWQVVHRDWLSEKPALFSAAITFLASLAVGTGYSAMSIVVYFIALSGTIGTLCFSTTRFPFSPLHGIYTVLTSHLAQMHKKSIAGKTSATLSVLRISLIPFLLALLFFLLYYAGNPGFSKMINSIHFKGVPGFFWTLLLGAVLLFGTFYQNHFWSLYLKEVTYKDKLSRDKENKKTTIKSLTAGLRKEKNVAALTLVFLNLLILLVNTSDIYFLIGGNLPEGLTYSGYVHQGVFSLILSILLAIGVILYYFRGSINFLKSAGDAKWLAYLWIVQNMMLALFTAHKNLLYVEEYGLTYKRIGVWAYIVLVLAGLLTTYFKVRNKQTTWHLIKVNSSIAMILLAAMSFVNWDSLIAKYGLYYSHDTDFRYLSRLSTRALPVLEDYVSRHQVPENFKNAVETKKITYLHTLNRQGWPSHTWADISYLTTHQKPD